MIHEPIVFMDLDETLLTTRRLEAAVNDPSFLFGSDPDEGPAKSAQLRRLLDEEVEKRMVGGTARDFSARHRQQLETERSGALEHLQRRGWKTMDLGGGSCWVAASRPGAASFLREIGAVASVGICTRASRAYAQGCLEALGFADAVAATYCYEDYCEGGSSLGLRQFVLVDDQSPTAGELLRTLSFLGETLPVDCDALTIAGVLGRSGASADNLPESAVRAAQRHHVEVSPWSGDPLDQVLGVPRDPRDGMRRVPGTLHGETGWMP